MKDDGRQLRILIAGMGNVLRRDDGFGVAVAQRLQECELPCDPTVIEVGTGGISLVQELMAPPGYDVLLLIDAVQGDGPAGRVAVLDADVPDLDDFPDAVRRDYLADMHYAVPSRALVLAKALGVLPAKTFIVGCQPQIHEAFEIGLSAPVDEAIATAVARVKGLLAKLNERQEPTRAEANQRR